jgi:signal transduction histidine kinase
MLAIALIPSLALLLVGLGISGYLVGQGISTYRWANDLQTAVGPATRIVGDIQLERWLSLVEVGGGHVDQKQLAAQRAKVDADVTTLRSSITAQPDLARLVFQDNGASGSPWNRLTAVRQQVNAEEISLLDTYTYYDQLLGPIANYTASVAVQAPNAPITDAQLTAASLYSATEDVARANALSFAAAIRGGMNGVEFAEYARQVGAYQSALVSLVPRMTTAEHQEYASLVASPAWQQLASVQDVLSSRGPTLTGAVTSTPLAVSQLDWQNDTLQVTARMLGLFDSHFQYAADLAASNGRNTLIRALIAGLVIILAGVAVLVVALRMSNRVSRRLARLRKETLDLAEEHLPRIVHRLSHSGGVDVDVEQEMPRLEHGQDEIGQVAEAFNKAQHTAVSAAVQEARTRQGANAVFLNIAHRSQVVAHRQLTVLDRAEHRQDDPEQVRLLFQLDHLATRARRNAENLIILGGRQPSRQWRTAVPIRDVLRSAIAETEHFTRIRISRLPQVAIAGRAVGDVVHLFAELLDNATAFAPPDARAEVHGNLVGRGVVIEIEDQGLGIQPQDRDVINANLLNPPDYGVMALSSDSRLGLFVVARLAARHGVRVTLTESVYGGTRVVVLLPTALIEDAPDTVASTPNAVHGVRRDIVDDGSRDTSGDTAAIEPVWPHREPVDSMAEPITDPTPEPAIQATTPMVDRPTIDRPTVDGPTVDGEPDDAPTEISMPVVEADPQVAPAQRNGLARHSGNGANGTRPPATNGNGTRPPANGTRPPAPNGNGTGNGSRSHAANGDAGRAPAGGPPPLPRRRRQTNLVPQLAVPPVARADADADGPRSAEQVRSAISAFQRGTRQGRNDDDSGNIGSDTDIVG